MQNILPAINNHQKFKKFLQTDYEYGILMNFQLAQLPGLVKEMKANKRKVLIHSELIKGLSADEYGAIYLIQALGVDGIISSKPKVIEVCKKRSVIGIFRFFLKDNVSLEQSFSLVRALKPTYIEILPAFGVPLIPQIVKQTDAAILVGGLIQNKAQIKECLQYGAVSVTTSNAELW